MNYPWHVYKKHLVALSCVTALAAFSLVARPAFAEEVKASDTNAKTEVVAPAIENVVATVETKTLDENPTATTTDAPTGTSIINSEATSVTTDTTAIPETAKPASEASSTVISETNSTRSEIPTSKTGATVSETASMENARYEDISENRLKTDVSSFNNDENTEIQDEDPEENITGGQWYSDVQGSWHYKKDGKDLIGAHVVDNQHVYFHEDGKQAKGVFGNDGYFYDKDSGAKIDLGTNRYVYINDNWYYLNGEGKILKGDQTIDGVQVHFDPYYGNQIKGEFTDSNGHAVKANSYTSPVKYYDKNSGALVKGQYFSHDGKWYYADAEGNILKGSQTIDGVHVYFDYNGVQAKDTVLDGYYYDKDSGARKELPRDQFIKIGDDLYYISSNGRTGNITIDGKDYYVGRYGRVLRGSFNVYQEPPYYDDETGEAVKKTGFVKSYGRWYYIEEDGKKAKGLKEIDGKLYFFSNNPMNKYETNEQVRGQLARPYFYISFPNRAEDNPTYYFDAETGAAVTNQFVYADGHWYYFGNDGKALLFDQVINGQHLYFDYEGKQVKGDFVTDYKGTRYYDENSGELVTNQTRTINGVTYHFDENGRAKQL